MSEFQLYQFRTIDRPLSKEERKEVEGLSSHINVSATSAEVSYSYGDFKHEPKYVISKYFDAMLYQTNWGQRQLMFRFPLDAIDYKQLSLFDIDGGGFTGYGTEIAVSKNSQHAFVNIEFCEDGFEGWVEEGNDLLDDLLGLRTEMLNGDFSCLYAFWLKLCSMQDVTGRNEAKEDDDYEDEEDDFINELPPVQIGLARPSKALEAFMDLYEIDPRIIRAAQKFVIVDEQPSVDPEQAIAKMNLKEKESWLLRLLEGETSLDIKFRKAVLGNPITNKSGRPTFEEILAML
jgi:hypothetical protein